MSLLTNLQFQPIDPASDEDEIPPQHQAVQQIELHEQIDEGELAHFWDQVERDIHEDPE